MAFSAIIVLGSAAVFIVVRASSETLLRSFIQEGDFTKARLYASVAATYHGEHPGWEGVQDFFLARREAGDADRVTLVDENGKVVADSGGAFLGSVHPKRHVAKGVPVIANGRQVGAILVGSMVDSSLGDRGDIFLASITNSLLAATLASTATAILLGTFFSLSLSRPLTRLTKAVANVAGGNLDTSVPVGGVEEIAALSRSFNTMINELHSLEEGKKRIIADSAHELRTPVTLIRGMIEAMIDGIYPIDMATLKSVHEETLRLSRLIDMLRELETIDSGTLALCFEEVDLNALMDSSLSLFGNAASEKAIKLAMLAQGKTPLIVVVDRIRFGEVIYNLLSNALRHAPVGGNIRVAVLYGDDGGFSLSVEDDGPGIPPEERGLVFERFYRSGKSRSSSSGGRGLGLSIAREIVRAHGGELTVDASPRLGGARFIVRVPSAPQG